MDTTTKHALPFPEGTDFLNALPATFQAHAEAVDAKLTPYSQGARASRPTSTPGTPGKAGRIYRSTDDGGVDVDHGTGWATVKPGSGTALPASPDDGMLWDLIVDSAANRGGPVVWRCRYRAAGGTYKWEAAGATLIDKQTTAGTVVATGEVVASITVPVGGVYECAGSVYAEYIVGGGEGWIGIAGSNQSGTWAREVISGTANKYAPLHVPLSQITAGAGQTITLFTARTSSTGALPVGIRMLSVRPVRLG